MERLGQPGHVILLNGAFGVGKTTVAHQLAERLPGARIFDPERIGYVLRRLPRWLPGSTASLDDYQDSPLWRRLTVIGARRSGSAATTIVPICIARPEYRDEIRGGLQTGGLRITEICLIASGITLAARLAARGVDPSSAEGRWVYPRAMAAADRLRAGGFGRTIHTDGLDAAAVTERTLAVVLQSSAC